MKVKYGRKGYIDSRNNIDLFPELKRRPGVLEINK